MRNDTPSTRKIQQRPGLKQLPGDTSELNQTSEEKELARSLVEQLLAKQFEQFPRETEEEREQKQQALRNAAGFVPIQPTPRPRFHNLKPTIALPSGLNPDLDQYRFKSHLNTLFEHPDYDPTPQHIIVDEHGNVLRTKKAQNEERKKNKNWEKELDQQIETEISTQAIQFINQQNSQNHLINSNQKHPALSLPPLEVLLKEKCRRNFRTFVEHAWHVIEPASPFVPGWHIDAICDHLQALAELKIRNLVIEVPPRSAKSTLVAVLFPAWCWIDHPGLRWIFCSYAHNLSKRDSRRCRALINSEWYQKRWGDSYRIAGDSNTVLRFDTTEMGFRFATSTRGLITGEGGDFIVADDMNNMGEVYSDKKRQEVHIIWEEVLSSRINNPKTGRFLVIAQRGHNDDLIGRIRSKDSGSDNVYLTIPAEYDPDRHCSTVIGWEDPRKTPGELWWPARFDQSAIQILKNKLGSYAYAAQFQQTPVPAQGGVFDIKWFKRYKKHQLPPPSMWSDSCISVDMSFGSKKSTASYVVAQAWCRVGNNFYLIDQVRGQWEYVESKAHIRKFLTKHHNIYAILIEDKANGPAIMDDLMHGDGDKDRGIPGIFPITPKGDKEARSRAVSPLAEAGNCYIPEDSEDFPWITDWIIEIQNFPLAAHDDQVDSMTQALSRLREGCAFGITIEEGSMFGISSEDQSEFEEVGEVVGMHLLQGIDGRIGPAPSGKKLRKKETKEDKMTKEMEKAAQIEKKNAAVNEFKDWLKTKKVSD